MLAFAIFGPAAGKLADTYGHRRVYLLGLAGAGLFAAATALSWNATSLIAFRVLGATLGAACGPASMAMINRLFSREARVQAMGYWSLVMAGGPVLGVVAGGPIVEAFGWRWIFVGQVPFVLAGLLIAFALLPASERLPRQPFDAIGAALLGGTTAFAMLALNRGPLMGWDAPARRRRVRLGADGIGAVPLAPEPVRLPAHPAVVRATPQLRVPDRHPDGDELRLHGRVHHDPAAAPGRAGLRRDPHRPAVDRQAAAVRHRRAHRRVRGRTGGGAQRGGLRRGVRGGCP
jgi:hypothetical protein